MLARNARAARDRRRGVVLILILAMLGLLALIGVTFATFSGQSQVGARNYAEAAKKLDPNTIIDFGLAQLINDTDNPVSAMRGHSLKRDMYGDDGPNHNGLEALPNGLPMIVTNVATAQILTAPNPQSVVITTNVPFNNYNFPSLVGANFNGWFLRLELWAYNGGSPVQQVVPPVAQTFQVIGDSDAGGFHQLVLSSNDYQTSYGANDFHLVQPNELGMGNGPVSNATRRLHFKLDNRYRFAFNGPGMGAGGRYGNFRLNNVAQVLLSNPSPVFPITPLGNPGFVGMDEDYDAPDLDNWFLAVQSADGSVVLPSFHRPGILRYQEDASGNTTFDDWRTGYNSALAQNTPANLVAMDSMSRFLRPRQIDHPRSGNSFPDLKPNTTGTPATNPDFGKITYDVDNDGDGVKDSVWLDLGFPVQRDAAGKLYKPLFSFMVLGLNGRLPLNTVGNLQDRSILETYPAPPNNPAAAHVAEIGQPTFDHTSHLGTSPSEINPKYALQAPPAMDLSSNPTGFDQFDNAGVDISLTQLRNLLAGTRPQTNPVVRAPYASWTSGVAVARPTPANNLDTNYVPFGNLNGGTGQVDYYYMPDGILETGTGTVADDDGVARTTTPIAGRWGEESAVPGQTDINWLGQTIAGVWNNVNGPGRSVFNDPAQAGAVNRIDGIDDNYDGLDFVPVVAGPANAYEAGDFVDPAYNGATAGLPWVSRLPSERLRRFVTPVDLAGTGRVVPFNRPPGYYLDASNKASSEPELWYGTGYGFDANGRVGFLNYFRPPGMLPGVADVYDSPVNFLLPGYNALHGFESHRTPNGHYAAMMGAAPYNVTTGGLDGNNNVLPPRNPPSWDYTSSITNILVGNTAVPLQNYGDDGDPATPEEYPPNGWAYPGGGLGLNDSTEMNLYTPTQVDAPFGDNDLEWLYRQQDIDGRSLTSRLSQLAPISFTNTFDLKNVSPEATASDGLARRRMFSIESWDVNSFAAGHASNMIQYVGTAAAGGVATGASSYLDFGVDINAQRQVGNDAAGNPIKIPVRQTGLSLAHRERRINLNLPLPVSSAAIEPVRQKWIRETYSMLKQILPPRAVDTPEELAALSQYVVNIIDFRDPDGTATRFINTDILVSPADPATNTPSRLAIRDVDPSSAGYFALPTGATPYDPGIVIPATSSNPVFLEQFGMEYSPIAINEILAFSFKRIASSTATDTPRFFVELVNTLTRDGHNQPGGTPDSSDLDLNALGYDMVIREDNAEGRPDPYTGQLPVTTNAVPAGAVWRVQYATGAPTASPSLGLSGTSGVNNYYYVFSNTSPDPASEANAPNVESASIPDTFFPEMGTGTAVIPNPRYYWLYLRRPANPNGGYQPDPALPNYNPMVVVDSIRFPYTEGGFNPVVNPMSPGTLTTPADATNTPQHLFSTQRLQPYRGGQIVPVLPTPPPGTRPDIDFRFGYSEQTTTGNDNSGAPQNNSEYHGQYGTNPLTREIQHRLGRSNEPNDPFWDYFPFNDRDFQSVAELLLVPACPPGLFTKRFIDAAPDDDNDPTTQPLGWIDYDPDGATSAPASRWDAMHTPPQVRPKQDVHNILGPPARRVSATGQSLNGGTRNNIGTNTEATPPVPRVFPYLATVDRDPVVPASGSNPAFGTPPQIQSLINKFYYSVPYNAATAPIQDPSFDDGWHKMLEYFEVPSPMLGAIAEVASGHNADWYRQDRRPGQLNLNLIIDEEVFFGLIDDPRLNLDRRTKPMPRMVTQVDASGMPFVDPVTTNLEGSYPVADRGFVGRPPFSGAGDGFMKAAFADFLKLRHGGNSNFIFHFLQGERPFRSLSNPDITTTILRPAHVLNLAAAPGSTRTDIPPGSRNDSVNMRFPDRNNAATTPVPSNVLSLNTIPTGVTGLTAPFDVPSPILPQVPHRRLFQVPDATGSLGTVPFSQASEQPMGLALTHTELDKEFASLISGSDPHVMLGGNTSGLDFPERVDRRQHPYWRTEWLQKVMNLTTVRSHQYAVWVTVGYFEVLDTGNPQLASDPVRFTEAVDELGPEIGVTQGRNVRHRAFFVLDRTRATGFDPRNPGDFREIVTFSRRIE